MIAWHDRRERLQAPCLVEHVFFLLPLVERVEAFAHEHVAGGAGADAVARVLDVDVVLEHDVAYGSASAPRATAPSGQNSDGQDDDSGHWYYLLI